MQSRAVLIGALCASARCRLLALDGIAFRLVARPVLPMRYVRRRWAYLVITTLPPAAVLARGRRVASRRLPFATYYIYYYYLSIET